MALINGALLAAALGLLAWLTWRDRAEYAAFKRLTTTEARQVRYRIWVAQSLAVFTGGSLAALAILGRLGSLAREPAEFQRLTAMLRLAAPASSHIGAGFGTGLAIGGLGSLAAGLVLARRRKAGGPVALGDVTPLLPRNSAEMVHTGLLSVSAGVGEELYFRLLLPLLMIGLGAPPLLAFVVATVIFGLAHLYQGWVGVAATTVVGALMAAIYLGSGVLAVAIAVHVGLDLFGLVVRPALTRLATPR